MDFRNSTISKILFGKNRMPAPESGESILNSFERRNREYEADQIAAKQLLNHPLLRGAGDPFTQLAGASYLSTPNNKLMNLAGGDIYKATKEMHKSLADPGVLGNFGRLAPASKEETNNVMSALQKNIYKSAALQKWYSKSAAEKQKVVDKLKGGLGDNRPDSGFNIKELRKGIEHETEHTRDRALAKEIAKDHLSERSDYYTALAKTKLAGYKYY